MHTQTDLAVARVASLSRRLLERRRLATVVASGSTNNAADADAVAVPDRCSGGSGKVGLSER